ncbi:hypothetical protein J6590_056770 [Homalodisca vitripennis]|nr:hypothetical protein J6590_056770 [Homalodisca vitripennis]
MPSPAPSRDYRQARRLAATVTATTLNSFYTTNLLSADSSISICTPVRCCSRRAATQRVEICFTDYARAIVFIERSAAQFGNPAKEMIGSGNAASTAAVIAFHYFPRLFSTVIVSSCSRLVESQLLSFHGLVDSDNTLPHKYEYGYAKVKFCTLHNRSEVIDRNKKSGYAALECMRDGGGGEGHKRAITGRYLSPQTRAECHNDSSSAIPRLRLIAPCHPTCKPLVYMRLRGDTSASRLARSATMTPLQLDRDCGLLLPVIRRANRWLR